MKLANLRIAARLALLGAFFVVALLVVAVSGSNALSNANARGALGLQQAAVLTGRSKLDRLDHHLLSLSLLGRRRWQPCRSCCCGGGS